MKELHRHWRFTMDLLSLLFVAAVACFTITAAASDLRTRRLPNWLTVSAFVAVGTWLVLGFAWKTAALPW